MTTPTLTPGQRQVQAACATRTNRKWNRWAEELRAAGWLVATPEGLTTVLTEADEVESEAGALNLRAEDFEDRAREEQLRARADGLRHALKLLKDA